MPAKVLVVDDEPDLQSLIRQKFRRQIRENVFEFVFAQSGKEALAKIDEHSDVSVVLSDINMPEMDGLTLLEKLNEKNNPTLKAIIVSAYGDMTNIRTAMNRGAFDFVTKPIDFNDLEVTINKTLGHLELIKRAAVEHEQLVAVRSDLNVATRIQRSILPSRFPAFPNRPEFQIFAQMVPAKEVGGDFYDFFFIDDDQLAVVIGDISGKGVPAALFMAVTRTFIRSTAIQRAEPGECLRRVNGMLIPDSDTSMFATVFYGVLNAKTGELRYSNGGHNPPYLVRCDGSVAQLGSTPGTLLGMLPNVEYGTATVAMHPGDLLFLYTDGVTEAMNGARELFEEPRLEQSLQGIQAVGITDVLQRIQGELERFCDSAPQSDDITMMALKFVGAA